MKQKVVTLAALVCVSGLFYSCSNEPQWKSLLGENLSEATYDPEVWSLSDDGVLGATEDAAIWSNAEYENFELDLEFKNDVNTNSGVVIYCTDKENWIPNAIEIQIADDYGDHFTDAHPHSKCGAVYGHLGASEQGVVKPAGEWNHIIIRAEGQHLTITLNDKQIVHADLSQWTSGTVNPDGSEIPSWLPTPYAELPTKGYIGFQGKHGESLIWFRNIKIRSL
jgi:hypothetical protein